MQSSLLKSFCAPQIKCPPSSLKDFLENTASSVSYATSHCTLAAGNKSTKIRILKKTNHLQGLLLHYLNMQMKMAIPHLQLQVY